MTQRTPRPRRRAAKPTETPPPAETVDASPVDANPVGDTPEAPSRRPTRRPRRPRAASTDAAPARAEPEPALAEPEPVQTEPEPALAEPEPVQTEPEPVLAELEPALAESEPLPTAPEHHPAGDGRAPVHELAVPAAAHLTHDGSNGAEAPTGWGLRLATEAELADWDEHTVLSPHGHVYQSRAWGEYRAAHGWQPVHIVFEDGFRLLVVVKEHPVIGGSWAYATRGPIPEPHVDLSAERVAAVAEVLGREGVDAFTVDGETPAEWGLRDELRSRGFDPTDELQPSRHRMDVRLGPDDDYNSDEKTIFASFGATTRNNIRQAERHGLRVKRLDAGGGRAEDDAYGVSELEGFEDVELGDPATTDRMLRTFYAMLEETAHRRAFALASEEAFLDWTTRGLRAGHVFYLQAEHDQDGPVAGATFYRHGKRLTYALAGDRADLRRSHPGAVRLLVWRGIQIALDERRRSVDLGGADTERSRNRPTKGHPNYGMYQFKESFGARWIDLTGAHQRTMHAVRHGVGTIASRALRRLARLCR